MFDFSSLSFLISVLYSKAKVAAACAGIIYFLSYVPYMYIAIKEDIAGDNISGIWKSLAVRTFFILYIKGAPSLQKIKD